MMHESTLERRVAFCETDMAGIVHFSNFFRYVEEAEAGLFRSLELGPLNRVWGARYPDGLGWVRLKAELEFISPARLDDLLSVRIWIGAKTRRELTFGTTVSLDGHLLARGWMTTHCVRQTPSRPKSTEIPREIDALLEVAPWGLNWPDD
ncbi:MAG: acyl-CoA thioesterase [Deltaproteobacteria bacterium]|nr:acyl-CoA thioesterase [Deltaproteobacteria bacterium]